MALRVAWVSTLTNMPLEHRFYMVFGFVSQNMIVLFYIRAAFVVKKVVQGRYFDRNKYGIQGRHNSPSVGGEV